MVQQVVRLGTSIVLAGAVAATSRYLLADGRLAAAIAWCW